MYTPIKNNYDDDVVDNDNQFVNTKSVQNSNGTKNENKSKYNKVIVTPTFYSKEEYEIWKKNETIDKLVPYIRDTLNKKMETDPNYSYCKITLGPNLNLNLNFHPSEIQNRYTEFSDYVFAFPSNYQLSDNLKQALVAIGN